MIKTSTIYTHIYRSQVARTDSYGRNYTDWYYEDAETFNSYESAMEWLEDNLKNYHCTYVHDLRTNQVEIQDLSKGEIDTWIAQPTYTQECQEHRTHGGVL